MDPALLTALSGTAQRASRPGKAARASYVCTAPARASRSPRQVLTSAPGAQLFSLTWLQVHAASWSAVKEDISAFSCRRPKPESIPLSGLASACILQPGFYVPRFLRNPRQGDSCGRTAALLGHLVTQRSDGRDQAPVAQFSSCRTWLGGSAGPCSPGAGAPAGRGGSTHCNHHSPSVLQGSRPQAVTSVGPGTQSGLCSFTACHPGQGA